MPPFNGPAGAGQGPQSASSAWGVLMYHPQIMDHPTASPSRPRRTPTPAGRLAWFFGGCAVASALFVAVGLLVLFFVMVGGQGSGNRGTESVRPNRASSPDQPVDLVEIAALVARPLVETAAPAPTESEAAALAELAETIARADALAKRTGPMAPVAADFTRALCDLQAAVEDAPSDQPLVRAGLDTWRSSLDGDDRGTVVGLLSVGSELIAMDEFMRRIEAIHARLVACRIRVGEAAWRARSSSRREPGIAAEFAESGIAGSVVAEDTLALTNRSGRVLTNAMVIVELTGRDGEQFTNLYYTDRWDSDRTLLAVCRSERPSRETVHHVVRVRARVLAEGMAGVELELKHQD